MKWIAITSPDFFEGEVYFINELVNSGAYRVHVRKPDSNKEQCVGFLSAFSENVLKRIVIHQHFELALKFKLCGIHLNKRNSVPPFNYTGNISRSCHSLEEVAKYKTFCNYVFLSPIFDSISKHAYESAFSMEVLSKASREGIIDEKVYALGGVAPMHIPILKTLNFGGAAMLGYIADISKLNHDDMSLKLKQIGEKFDN